ncbi:acyl-CoA dehydrogenase family protein, partial [Rhodopseudomonas sp. BAL398]|uniref:acyl-CoA dehydrogenase family protein n=1 Tax=Rhodopseudomonas sp. BAL398 TaxID=3034676 RepID=UPI0023E29CF1
MAADDDIGEMLRTSVRGLLGAEWSDRAARSADAAAVRAFWNQLVALGITSLGAAADGGGLREGLIVLAELGRAACPAPMLSALLANLALLGCEHEAARQLLHDIGDGTARVSFAFGTCDPDPGAGSIRIEGATANGTLRFVEAADAGTHLLAAVGASELALVPTTAAGVDIVRTRAMGAPVLCEIRLRDAPAAIVTLDEGRIGDLLRIARLALVARAQGAARRAFDLATTYAKQRHQFGQPIGRFQAVQHKLADGLIALEGGGGGGGRPPPPRRGGGGAPGGGGGGARGGGARRGAGGG